MQDAKLSVRERLLVRLHLALCDACQRFERQVALLRNAMRRYKD